MNKRLVLITAVVIIAAIAGMAYMPHASRADVSEDRVKEIVKTTLKDNPEIIIDALNAYREKQAKQSDSKAQEAIKTSSKDLFEDSTSPTIGNPKGDVTIVEFFDYHCGYCKKFYPSVKQLTDEDKNVKVVFKEFPILSEDSELAAKAAMAVYEIKPEKYFEYHGALMDFKGKYDEAVLTQTAKNIGIDEKKFKEKLSSPEIAKAIADDKELGQKIGVRGTPAIVIGDKLYPGAMSSEALKKAIADVRAAKK